MEDQRSPVKLLSSKNRRYSVDNLLCFICKKPDNVRTPGTQGKSSFINALIKREKCGQYHISELLHMIDIESKHFYDDFTADIRWHKNCYSSFVSKRNLEHIDDQESIDSCSSSLQTRSSTPTVDLKRVCLFCNKTNHKGNKSMARVEYEQFRLTLERSCKEKGDAELPLKIGGDFSKIPALEPRYHKTCYASYVKPVYTKTSTVNYYNDAFERFIPYFDSLLKDNRAIPMDKLLDHYKSMLINCGVSSLYISLNG